MEFIKTIASLGCLPQFIVAIACLVAMVAMLVNLVALFIKEINNV